MEKSGRERGREGGEPPDTRVWHMRRLLLLSNGLRARVHRRVLGQVCFSYHLGRLVLAAVAQARHRARVHAAVWWFESVGSEGTMSRSLDPLTGTPEPVPSCYRPQKGRERHARRQARTLKT